MSGWQPLLERVVRERYARLVATAMLLVPSRAEAEDLVQEAIVSTFAGRARFATVSEAEAYLRRAVVSRSIDSGRRRAAERRAVGRVALERPAEDPAGIAPQVELALLALPPRVRACVVLRHLEDMSVRDTAAALRLSEGAVKRYVSDGVAALQVALGAGAPQDRQAVRAESTGEPDA